MIYDIQQCFDTSLRRLRTLRDKPSPTLHPRYWRPIVMWENTSTFTRVPGAGPPAETALPCGRRLSIMSSITCGIPVPSMACIIFDLNTETSVAVVDDMCCTQRIRNLESVGVHINAIDNSSLAYLCCHDSRYPNCTRSNDHYRLTSAYS